MSFSSAISRIARPLVVGRQLLSSSSLLPSSSSSSSSSCSSLPRSFSTSTPTASEDSTYGFSNDSPSSSSSSSRPLHQRRTPSPSRSSSRSPPSNLRSRPVGLSPKNQARSDQKQAEGTYGLSEPLSPSSTTFLSPTSLPSVLSPPPLPQRLSLTLPTLSWFETLSYPNWHRLLHTLDPPTRLDYQRKYKYLKRALTKPSLEMKEHYLSLATELLNREDERATGKGALRIEGPKRDKKDGGEFFKSVNVFKNKDYRGGVSPAEWFLLSEQEKEVQRQEARERLVRETPEEGGEREELLRRLEEMDRGKEERRRRREGKE
ncbi:hypothetical protein BDY24DRAFT_443239 [Mrakia frigida]|uniref:uncharacterized protein n=1 Tax=Mrakia frigida TaxID=29902 RepID=UPI003FCBF2A5